MRHAWLAAGLWIVLACSGGDREPVPQESSVTTRVPEIERDSAADSELIPAEWTVSEDTSQAGEVTAISLQLPTARDIRGLLDEQAPRLILRCVAGEVQAFIDTESAPGLDTAPLESQLVRVQLDSAPACE